MLQPASKDAGIVRMQTILRFAKDPRTKTGPRQLIADAEARLTALGGETQSAKTNGSGTVAEAKWASPVCFCATAPFTSHSRAVGY